MATISNLLKFCFSKCNRNKQWCITLSWSTECEYNYEWEEEMKHVSTSYN